MPVGTGPEPGTFSRRAFVRGAGALVVALGAARLVDPAATRAATEPGALFHPEEYPLGIRPAVDPGRIDSWLAIRTDGTVVLKTGKVELGQGTGTFQRQLVADELDVPLERVEHLQGDTWHTVDQGYTAGSNSVRTETGPNGIRQAAAEARAALLGLASERLGVPQERLAVARGVVRGGGRSVTYAELVGGKAFGKPITGKAKPKPYTAYDVVGTSARPANIPPIVFGSFTYAQDLRVPGMVHARVVRPPTLDSKLVAVRGFPGKPPEGFLRTVVKGNYVAVVAKTEWGAIEASKALRVSWDVAPLPPESTYLDSLRTTGPSQDTVLQDSKVENGNDVDAVLAATPASRKVTATYTYPIQMHGSMGTSAATAVVDRKRKVATVWSSTQGVYPLRGAVAQALGLPEQNVHVIFVEGSGCYGLNKADDVAIDAAVMAAEVGRPVHVQHTRSQEHRWENFGQPYWTRITAAFDRVGGKTKLTAWRRDAWTTNRGGRPGPPSNMASGILMGFPEEPLDAHTILTPTEELNSVDGSNSAPSYRVAAARVTSHVVRKAFLTGPLRSPNRIQSTHANETMMDELAHLARVDPVQFRLDNLDDPRVIAVIRTAADAAGWRPRPSASEMGSGRRLTGRGISAMHYAGRAGYNAAIVQVTVDTKTGKVDVDHVWTAQDCGPALNPDGMRLQAEGCVMQGISRSLIEQLRWRPDGIVSDDWVTYPVVRFKAMPRFDFRIVDRPDEPAVGAGEVLITNMPAAISNAIFDATGKRLRDVPFTPARVRAALRSG